MKKNKVLNILSLVFNAAIIGAVVFGITRITDIVGSLKYFTVLSNLLLALAALICIPFNIIGIARGEKLKKGALIFKYVAVVSTAVTFITAATFLAAQEQWNVAKMLGFDNLMGVNFYLHFLAPVTGLLSFVLFDRSQKLKFKSASLPLLPVVGYGIFYVLNLFLGFVKAPAVGSGDKTADWYGLLFVAKNQYIMFGLILLGFLLATYVIAICLLLCNNLLNKEEAPKVEQEEAPAEEKAEEAQEEAELEEEAQEEAPVQEEEKAEEPQEEPEDEPEPGEEVYIPVRDEEEPKEEKKPAKKAEKKEAPKAEEKEEPKAEEKPVEKKAPAKKEAKPAAKEEKKPAPAKKEEKPAPKAEEKKPAKAEEKKPTPKKEAPKAEPKKEPAKKEAAPAPEKPTKVYHLSKRKEDGMWAITFVGGSKAVKLFKTKKEAEEALKVLTENQGATALIRNSKGAKAGKFASSIKTEK